MASPPLFCRAKLYTLLFISKFRIQPLKDPEVSRKWAVFEKCPSGEPKMTGSANVILEKSPCYRQRKMEATLVWEIEWLFEMFGWMALVKVSNMDKVVILSFFIQCIIKYPQCKVSLGRYLWSLYSYSIILAVAVDLL